MEIHGPPFLAKLRGPLDGKGMDGQAVRLHGLDPGQGVLHIRRVFSGKPCDQVHIDIVKSEPPCHCIRRPDVLHGMLPPHQVQRLLLHGLGVDGDPCDGEFSQHGELFLCDAVRPPSLHGKLHGMAQVEILRDLREQPPELVRLQRGRRASADVHGVRVSPLRHSPDGPEFSDQRVQITVHPVLPHSDWRGAERAVGAHARAERDARVQAEPSAAVQFLQKRLLPAGDLISQLRLCRSDKIFFLKKPCDLLSCLPLLQHLHRQLGRADSRKSPPGKLPAGLLTQKAVDSPGHRALLRLSRVLLRAAKARRLLYHGLAPGVPYPVFVSDGLRPGPAPGILRRFSRNVLRRKGKARASGELQLHERFLLFINLLHDFLIREKCLCDMIYIISEFRLFTCDLDHVSVFLYKWIIFLLVPDGRLFHMSRIHLRIIRQDEEPVAD